MNTFGLLLGLATLFIIGLGFPLVIVGERYFGHLWWPYLMGLGFLVIIASCLVPVDGSSAVTGIIGATLVWSSTELKEQSKRVQAGWFPNHPRKIRPPFEAVIEKWRAPHL